MKKTLSEMSLEQLWQLFPIKLSAYNPVWKDWYLHEKKLLVETIGKGNIRRINHIGSTSVDGLIAKPTIDILIEIRKNTDTEKMIKSLKNINYIFDTQPEKPPPHMMFMKGYTENGYEEKVFHLHIRYLGDWDELYFRDYLQICPKIAKEYTELKIKLKQKFEHDRDGYTNAKTDFINKCVKLARLVFQKKYLAKK